MLSRTRRLRCSLSSYRGLLKSIHRCIDAAWANFTAEWCRACFQNRLAGGWCRNGEPRLAYREAMVPNRCPQPEGRPPGLQTRFYTTIIHWTRPNQRFRAGFSLRSSPGSSSSFLSRSNSSLKSRTLRPKERPRPAMRLGPRIKNTTKRKRSISKAPTVISIVSTVHGGSYASTLAHATGLFAALFKRENTATHRGTGGVVVGKW